MIGQTISHYKITEKLGEGGMGEVYLAEDASLKRKVALKFPPDYLQQDEVAQKRFLREAQSAAALDHPFICHIHEIGEAEARPFIAMEYVDGETLRNRLARERFSYREVLRIGDEISEALQRAHQHNIVHRDLKPSNIMLTPEGRVKVMDFGLAKKVISEDGTEQDITAGLTKEGTTLGTLAYMSPEQLRGDKVDARSDIFSLGVVLYEILIGKHPFRGKGSMETASAILKEEAEFPAASQAGPGIVLHKIIQSMLVKDPAQRCQSIQEVHTKLEQLLVDVTPVPWVRRWPYWIGALAAIVLMAGLFLLLNQPTPEPKLMAIRQITRDGATKTPWFLETDGHRIYYVRGGFSGGDIYQVSVEGGPSTPVIQEEDVKWFVLDISKNGAELLLRRADDSSLWTYRLPAGPRHRLSELVGGFASWSPDGDHIAYTKDSSVYVTDSDGANPKKLCTTEEPSYGITWSPDGSRLRFTVGDPVGPGSLSIWEVTREGTNLHKVIENAIYGYWTVDGAYYIFHRREKRPASSNFWVIHERSGLFGKRESEPAMLWPAGTQGFPFSSMTPDGRRIIAVGVKPEGQLMQYDSSSGHWLPYLAGISAHSLDFSKDEEWVTYVDLVSKNLWRSKIDGTQPQPLTGSDFLVASPRFSPEGTRIAFLAGDPPIWENTQLYLVAAEGGEPELVVEGARPRSLTWHPDGNQIAFDNNFNRGIEVLDLKTRLTEMIPGSETFKYPQWSPDGHYMAALGRELNELMLFNFETGEWSKVGENADYPEWSRQGRPYIYYIRDRSAFRVRITDSITKKVADFGFGLAGGYDDNPRWIGLAPDDSVLTLRRESVREIYTLDFEGP